MVVHGKTVKNAFVASAMILRDLIILREAEQDAQDAYAWYEQQESGLGEEFLRCVDACI